MDDLSRFPSASAYLAALPHGYSSYPEAQLNTDVLEPIRESYPNFAHEAALPLELVAVFEKKKGDPWIAEVPANCLLLACHDHLFKTSSDYLRWSYDCLAKLFEKPMYRLLMYVLSPTLIAMGAAKRWGAFHRGTQLAVSAASRTGARTVVKATLVYPANHYTPLLVEYFTQAFLAALHAGHAEEPRVDITSCAPIRAEYDVSWLAH